MNDNLQNTLADLAKKLGTTADQLWPVMMKQVQMDAAWSARDNFVLFSGVVGFVDLVHFLVAKR